ncbi:tetratricopeptide repeat-containing diguanylate cyclase [Shewanella insulae]|uniref:tetratricopeptide repeat-containing diguanylate cyclase n=1 Tax=Shewanella insulae TaxID=2681496 RepID=UPI0024800B36|nr:GGDEF domain-containing protein [Shewanella insulae]
MTRKTKAKSWLTSLLLCLGLSLFGLSPVSQAQEDANEQIDAIFDKFDQGEYNDQQAISEALDYLTANVTMEDTKRYLKLQTVLCWNNYDITKQQALKDAIAFADLKLLSEGVATSAETTTDLKLCRAFMHQLLGKVDVALEEYNKVVAEAYLIESPRLIADSRSLRGAIYSFQGNFAQALEDLITAQHLYESLNLQHWAIYNLTELATSYRRFGDPQTAIKYYRKLEKGFEDTGDRDGANAIKTEIGFALEELGEYDAALKAHKEAYQYWRDTQGEEASSYTAVNVAGVLIQLHREGEAKPYLDLAEKHVQPEVGGSYSFMRLYQAQSALNKGQYSQALDYIDKAKQSFQAIKNARGLEKLHMVHSQIFVAEKDWKQAYEALLSYIQTHKSLDATQQTNRTTEMRTRFNTEQIERENQQLIELQKIKENELVILKQNKYLQLAVIVLGCIIMLILSIVAYKQSQKSKLLSILALTDHLTQLPNRRYTYSKGEGYFKSKDEGDHPLSIILFDADHFKKVNDKYGHDIGDKVLIALANISNGLMRKQDLVGRVGGEEFLVILPGTTAEQALNIAQRLVTTVESSNFDDVYVNFKLTISAGIASVEGDKSFEHLLKRADDALYRAKSSGRNCAVLDTQ